MSTPATGAPAPTASTPAAPASPAAPATPAPKPTGKASDHLAAAVAQAQGGTGGTGQGAKVAQAAETPAAPAKPELTKEQKEAENRLGQLARERRKFEEEKKAHAAKVADTERKAALWDKLEAAKTAGKAMGVLRQLWDQKEIDTRVYNELAADILERTPGDEPLTPAQVQEMMDARIAAEKEAEKKAAETAKAEKASTARKNYLSGINKAFDPAKYPLVEEFKIQPEQLLSSKRNEKGEIVEPGFVDKFFAEHDELPTAEQIFDHFEAMHRARVEKVTKPAQGGGVPEMVTGKMTAETQVEAVDYAKMTPAQKWAWAKKQAGIMPGM